MGTLSLVSVEPGKLSKLLFMPGPLIEQHSARTSCAASRCILHKHCSTPCSNAITMTILKGLFVYGRPHVRNSVTHLSRVMTA